MVHTSY